MDIDDRILKKLFGNDAEKKLTDPEYSQYLQELSSYGSERLSGEPERLGEEKSNLQDETENLAFSNYKTFIQAANCSKDIFEDFTLIDQHLEGVVNRLPELATECRSFLQEAQKISGRRAANSLTLHKHPHILEVLEIPQVMDTCVRANYWEEALELAQYVAKLQRRLGHIPVIQSIAKEVESQRQLLLEQLVDQLHTQLSLPQCLKVVGYLRRLAAFTETELRVKFLLARDNWLRGLLAAIPADDPYQHITKVMEQSRVHLFDIITQYKAVFSDDDPLTLAGAVGAPGGWARVGTREELPTNYPAIFQGWLFQKINEFLSTLETDLGRGVAGRLDSVLAQCMYFGLSFGRVGADFRALVCPLFERAALQEFHSALDSATARMLHELSSENFLDNPSNFGTHAVTTATFISSQQQTSSETLSPPTTLMDWTGLALYCNAILSSFNDIRLCLPLTIGGRVAEALNNSLKAIADSMIELAESNEKNWSPKKLTNFKTATRLLVDQFIPYLNRCLATMFPANTIGNLLGAPSAQHQRLVEMCRVDAQAIREQTEKYLPPKPIMVLPEMIKPTTEAAVAASPTVVENVQPVVTETGAVSLQLGGDALNITSNENKSLSDVQASDLNNAPVSSAENIAN